MAPWTSRRAAAGVLAAVVAWAAHGEARLGGARRAQGADGATRQYNLDIRVVSCSNLVVTRAMISSTNFSDPRYEWDTLPDGVTIKTRLICEADLMSADGSTRLMRVSPGYFKVVSGPDQVPPNFANLTREGSYITEYVSSAKYVLDGQKVTLIAWAYNLMDNRDKVPYAAKVAIGKGTLALPSATQLPAAYSKIVFGSGLQWGSPQTVQMLSPLDNLPYGSCSVQVRVNPKSCLAGEQVEAGSGLCAACPAGSFGDGANACQYCAAGSYGAAVGASSCLPCAAGFWCPIGSTSQQACPAGQYSLAGSGSCTQCKAGFIGTGSNRTTEECGGPCPPGLECPTGTASLAAARRCADPAAFCGGSNSVPELVRPGFFAVARAGVFVAQESCPRGHKCVGGLKEACPAGEYQDATGATACKACVCGAADTFTGCTAEARAAAPVCAACAITDASRAAKCDSLSVFIGCTNTSHTDSSRCVNCELLLNATNSSEVIGSGNASSVAALTGTAGDVDPKFLADCKSLLRSSNATVVNNTTVNGLPAWVIAVIVSVIAVVAVVVTAFVVRKRKQMRERLEELDRKNKSMESDQDLAVTLGQNINPMFRKINPDPKRGEKERIEMAAAEKIHLEEVEEINKHKRALEEELRRLKQEAQVNEVSAQGHASTGPKMQKRKEFQGGDIAMQ